MRLQLSYAVWIALLITEASLPFVEGRKSSSGGRAPPSRRPTGGRRSSSSSGGGGARPSTSRRRMPVEQDPYEEEYDEEEEDEVENFYPGDEDLYDDEEEEDLYDDEGDLYDDYEPERPSPRRRSSGSSNNSRRGPSTRNKRGGPPPSSSRRSSRTNSSSSSRSGRVVPYSNRRSTTRRTPQPSAFTRGLTALRDSIPDPASLKDATANSIAAAKSTTSRLSSNIYRDIKGLTSSELEQVMLKATKPDDSPVKGQHVERLVGVTYQISGRYDIYDAVLRKLWAKMVEKDWRTTIKALYILHRFAADGAPDHQAALKARLRELRRTRDPKRKDKYFNSKQLLAGDSTVRSFSFFGGVCVGTHLSECWRVLLRMRSKPCNSCYSCSVFFFNFCKYSQITLPIGPFCLDMLIMSSFEHSVSGECLPRSPPIQMRRVKSQNQPNQLHQSPSLLLV